LLGSFQSFDIYSDKFDKKVQESLQFLKEQKAFIDQLVEIGKIFK